MCVANGSPCEHHRGPSGAAVRYTGPDAYEPTDYVREVMSERWRGWHASGGKDVMRIWECFGFDPRAGYWMRTVDDGPVETTNISYRAIDVNWHRVHMTFGAHSLACAVARLGRLPANAEECPNVDLQRATQTLRDLGLLTPDGALNDQGRSVAAKPLFD